jgi:hypothetical protein
VELFNRTLVEEEEEEEEEEERNRQRLRKRNPHRGVTAVPSTAATIEEGEAGVISGLDSASLVTMVGVRTPGFGCPRVSVGRGSCRLRRTSNQVWTLGQSRYIQTFDNVTAGVFFSIYCSYVLEISQTT